MAGQLLDRQRQADRAVTVFPKVRQRETGQVARAQQALKLCVARGHTVDGDNDERLEAGAGSAHG